MNNKKPIGVFDSGLGGLTVLEQLIKLLPQEQFIYLGDTAHVPYGNKSPQTIIERSLKIVKFLEQKNVKLIVVGCNTASAVAQKKILQTIKIPTVNVISPGIIQALEKTKNNNIAIIGTQTTINSKAYQNQISILNDKIKIITQACPLLVPMIEEGLIKQQITQDIINMYLNKIKKTKYDTLILGCTHYPLIKKIIAGKISQKIEIIDSSIITAKYVKQVLKKHNMRAKNIQQPKNKFYITDTTSKFKAIAKRFIQAEIIEVKKINI